MRLQGAARLAGERCEWCSVQCGQRATPARVRSRARGARVPARVAPPPSRCSQNTTGAYFLILAAHDQRGPTSGMRGARARARGGRGGGSPVDVLLQRVTDDEEAREA